MALVSYHWCEIPKCSSKNDFGTCAPPLEQLEHHKENYSFFMTFSFCSSFHDVFLFRLNGHCRMLSPVSRLTCTSTFGFAFFFLVHPLSWMFSICFQDISGISEVVEASRNHEVSNGNQALEDTNGGASSYGRFGLRFPSISTSFLSRTRSATNAMLQQTRSSSQQ